MHDRGARDAEAVHGAVAARDLDLVADRDIAEEGEMRVAVGGVDRGAVLAGGGVPSTWPGPNASACPLLPCSTIALLPSRGTSTRATGQVSAQDHGFTA